MMLPPREDKELTTATIIKNWIMAQHPQRIWIATKIYVM